MRCATWDSGVVSHPKRSVTPRTKTCPWGPQRAFRMGHPGTRRMGRRDCGAIACGAEAALPFARRLPMNELRSTVVPALRYNDAPAAIDWLCQVFGFERHAVHEGPDGTIAHAELALGGGMIMLGSTRNDTYG